jgi:hypothetical protein
VNLDLASLWLCGIYDPMSEFETLPGQTVSPFVQRPTPMSVLGWRAERLCVRDPNGMIQIRIQESQQPFACFC